jgi:hypothetical protein
MPIHFVCLLPKVLDECTSDDLLLRSAYSMLEVQLQRRLVEQRDELVSRTTGELTSECWRTGSRSEFPPNFQKSREVWRDDTDGRSWCEPVILHEAMKVRARNVFSRAVVVDFAAYTAQDFSRVAVSVRLYPGLTVPISVKESAPRQQLR